MASSVTQQDWRLIRTGSAEAVAVKTMRRTGTSRAEQAFHGTSGAGNIVYKNYRNSSVRVPAVSTEIPGTKKNILN